MFSSLFWGLVLIIVGISVLFGAFFNMSIPVIKIISAAVLIYLGINLLMPNQVQSWKRVYWSKYDGHINSESKLDKESYNVSFISSNIDLSYLSSLDHEKSVNVSTQFADVNVILPNIPVRVKANSAFSSLNMPNGKNQYEYSNLRGSNKPLLTVYINAVFSNVNVRD